MMPYTQLERRKDQLDAAEQAAIEKEQWIDDEAARLLTCFPDKLSEFRPSQLHPQASQCCTGASANAVYQDFILNLAYLQANENYDLQVLLKWEEPCQ
ncbi:hypothetical protein QU24_02265 [Pantoea rodasii]|uniref:Host nuclease inhibitor GamL n=1 Tax=Pantoea rodasii TaxID=1076549 RepID=A0A0B1RDH4_9GAMM|nr:host nuclease inhibitor GamL [Pantoea rodasii]KHJ69701.1 hypothetical protein QU24_02265 [Pantoea rodasii]